MVRVYYKGDIDDSAIYQRRVAVIGYGSLSDTAKFGGLKVGPRVVDSGVRENMKMILKDIQSGKFAKSWTGDPEKTAKELNTMISELERHSIEKVGRDIRKLSGLEE